MKINILQEEITNDPLGRGYSNMSNEEVATDLNTKYRNQIGSITSAELLAWAGGGANDNAGILSRYERIENAAVDHASLAIRGLCKAAVKLIERDGTSLDLTLVDRQEFVAALVAGGVLTSDESSELYTLATNNISRASELNLSNVGPHHVAIVRS